MYDRPDGLKSDSGFKKYAFADSTQIQTEGAVHSNPRRRVFHFQTRVSVRRPPTREASIWKPLS